MPKTSSDYTRPELLETISRLRLILGAVLNNISPNNLQLRNRINHLLEDTDIEVAPGDDAGPSVAGSPQDTARVSRGQHREWKLLVNDEGVPMGGGVFGGKWNENTTVPDVGEIVRAQEVPNGYVGIVVREDLAEQARIGLEKLMPEQTVPWESALLEALELPEGEQPSKVESLLSDEDRGRLADAEYERAHPEYAERARERREYMLKSLYHAVRQVRTGEVVGILLVTTRQNSTDFSAHGVPPTAPGILLLEDIASRMRADYCEREYTEVDVGRPVIGLIDDKPSDTHFEREVKLSKEDETDA